MHFTIKSGNYKTLQTQLWFHYCSYSPSDYQRHWNYTSISLMENSNSGLLVSIIAYFSRETIKISQHKKCRLFQMWKKMNLTK